MTRSERLETILSHLNNERRDLVFSSDIRWLLEEVEKMAKWICGERCGEKHSPPCFKADGP